MASSPRVLITGASGLLGRQLMAEFLSNGWSATGLAFSRADKHPNLRRCDLRQSDDVRKVFGELRPQVVIHAAAERRPDVTEKDPSATEALNVSATRTIAEAAGAAGAFLVYISTDYVFDGKAAPYKTDASPNPLNAYGQSKLAGERVVREVLTDGSCVLRVPILYGDVETLDESAVTVLFKSVLTSSSPAKHNDHQRRFPTHVADVSTVCRQIADRCVGESGRNDVTGILHWSGNECFTKLQMAKRMAEVFGLKSDHLSAAEEVVGGAPRPYDCQLDCSALEELGIGQRTSFDDGIKKALGKFTSQ